MKKKIKFRDTASFGKRIEYSIIGEMLKEGLDVYTPMVDDMGIDAVVRKSDGTFLEVQIKARSEDVKFGDAGLFSVNKHLHPRNNYFFVFYSQRMNTKWIMSSEDFVENSRLIENGKNKGSRQIWFSGKNTKKNKEHTKPQFKKFVSKNFDKLK
jgi:hypothetical protein|tara:strand:- start:101 stop:562 length:462 start_codon:yes stop_codon:yes gene_type:complete